jgi:hypothetical protein
MGAKDLAAATAVPQASIEALSNSKRRIEFISVVILVQGEDQQEHPDLMSIIGMI